MDRYIESLASEGVIIASRGDQLLRVSLPVRYGELNTLMNELESRGAKSIDFSHEVPGSPQLVIWTSPVASRFYWTPFLLTPFLLVLVVALYWSVIVNTIEGLLP